MVAGRLDGCLVGRMEHCILYRREPRWSWTETGLDTCQLVGRSKSFIF